MRVVITGANRGIGLEFVQQCLARGDEVWAGMRSVVRPSRLAPVERTGVLHVAALDVDNQWSVGKFAEVAGDAPLDLLINNAAVSGQRSNALAEASAEEAISTLGTNAVGPLRVTQALLPVLRAARAKVVHISSNLGSIQQNRDGGSYDYRMSKAALNMLARTMAAELRPEGIVSVLVSPGWVKTEMGGPDAPTSAREAVQAMLRFVDTLTLAESGGFFDASGAPLEF
ncbi:MAG: SDR family oxidoreductase [Deltaproteobacteria bacterium]|nr:SDR family oxidoreductase [Deltaproteobacteria bacterium]